MAEFIRRRDYVTVVEYRYEYTYAGTEPRFRGCGFSFPCEKDGTIKFDEMEMAGKENLMYAIQAAERGEYYDEGVVDHSREVAEPAVIKCNGCQRHLTLDSLWENECECGCLYNGSGQQLRPREEWGEETGETYADIVTGDPFAD